MAMLDPVAHSWCPVIPLSELTIDWDGIYSGEVQSLHASAYVSFIIIIIFFWPSLVDTNISSKKRLN